MTFLSLGLIFTVIETSPISTHIVSVSYHFIFVYCRRLHCSFGRETRWTLLTGRKASEGIRRGSESTGAATYDCSTTNLYFERVSFLKCGHFGWLLRLTVDCHTSRLAPTLPTAQRMDEGLWSLPLEPSYKDLIKSSIADLRNIGGKSGGGSITAALFLKVLITCSPCLARIGQPTARSSVVYTISIFFGMYTEYDGDMMSDRKEHINVSYFYTNECLWCPLLSDLVNCKDRENICL